MSQPSSSTRNSTGSAHTSCRSTPPTSISSFTAPLKEPSQPSSQTQSKYPTGIIEILQRDSSVPPPVDYSALGLNGFNDFSLSSVRKRPLPTPPTSPRSTSPGRASTLDSQRNILNLFASQTLTSRKEVKRSLRKLFPFAFSSARTLFRALDELHAAFSRLASPLHHNNLPPEDFESLDSKVLPILEECDRIVCATRRGNKRTGPFATEDWRTGAITEISRWRKMNAIKNGLGPQMLELTGDVKNLQAEVDDLINKTDANECRCGVCTIWGIKCD